MGDTPPQGTGAVPGDAMSLTAAERLTVQALIINDLTPFAGADIAAILADTATISWADITGIINDIGVFPTANYATIAAYVEDMRTRLIAILADVTGLAGAVMRGTDGAATDAILTAAHGAGSWAGEALPTQFLITPASQHSIGTNIAAMNMAAPASVGWGTADRAMLVPFVLMEAVTVLKLFVHNGGVLFGNVDVGIYDAAFNRLVSSGSVAQAGVSQLQEFDVADTGIGPGQFYLAIAFSEGATETVSWTLNEATINGEALGLLTQASAFPLPDPFVPVVFDDLLSILPIFGLSLRTLVT